MSDLHPWYKRKGYCTSILDTPCRTSEQAREIETRFKEAEKEGGGYYRLAFVSEAETKAIEETKTKTATVIASTDSVDRDKEVVVPSGIDLRHYRKNPVVLFAHDISAPPVGRAQWAKVDGGKLKAGLEFAKRPSDYPPSASWFPDDLFALISQGILKGISIGFIGQASPPTTKELVARPDWAQAKGIIRKSLLAEISVVAVPSNQEALIQSFTKGLLCKDTFDRFGIDYEDEPELWSWDTKDYLPEQKEIVKAVEAPVNHRLELLKQLRNSLHR